MKILVLSELPSKELHPFFQRLECLLAWLTGGFTENKLGFQSPVSGNTPRLRNLFVDQWVVVLEIGSEPFLFKCGPY